MGRRVSLFCEDRGHETFARALVERIGLDTGQPSLRLDPRSATGGKGRARRALSAYVRALRGGHLTGIPDLLVVLIDANCDGWNEARRTCLESVEASLLPRLVVGNPDPHVERWCIADEVAFCTATGARAPPDPGKCDRDLYRSLLRDALLSAGQIVLTDAMEFAPDIIQHMDLYRAGKSQPSLGAFISDLRSAITQT